MSTRAMILLGVALSTGVSLLPIQTAQAQAAPLQLEATVQSTTVDPQTGEVIVSGTVTCSEPADASIYVSVNQPLGRGNSLEGFNYAPQVRCDQDGEPYTISLFPYEGRFAPGRARVTVDAYASGPSGYDDAHLQQAVRLTRR
jgi:hypothetical protein